MKKACIFLIGLLLTFFVTGCDEEAPVQEENPVQEEIEEGVFTERIAGQLVDEFNNFYPDTELHLISIENDLTPDVFEVISVDTTDNIGNFVFEFNKEELKKLAYMVIGHPSYGVQSDNAVWGFTSYADKIVAGEKIILSPDGYKECTTRMYMQIEAQGITLNDNDRIVVEIKGKKIISLAKGEYTNNNNYEAYLCPGEYMFILKRNETIYSARYTLKDSQDAQKIVLTLKDKEEEPECCPGDLEITLKDKDGNEINDTEVWLRKHKDFREVNIKKYTIDSQVLFENVCESTYEIRIAREGYKVIEEVVEIKCDMTNSLEFTLQNKEEGGEKCCDNIIDVLVLDGSGQPIKGAKVLLRKNGKGISDPKTNNDGKAQLKELCEGEGYSFLVGAPGYKQIESENFEIECNVETMMTFTLEKK
jgi:hypothetical protein